RLAGPSSAGDDDGGQRHRTLTRGSAFQKVTIDQELRARLNGLTENIELCDESGRTLAHVVPPEVYPELLRAWVDSHITPEEIERRRPEPRGRSLVEIWKDLQQP